MKEKYGKFYIILIIILVVSLSSCKTFLKAEQVNESAASYLYDLSLQYNKIESYRAKITMISGDGKNDLMQTGIFYYKKPSYYRLELYIDSKMQDLIIKDKKYKWHYSKWLNTVVKYKLDNESEQNMELLDIVTGYIKQRNMVFLGKKQIDGNNLYIFTGKFNYGKDNANITFYLQDNGIIKIIEMVDTQDNFRIVKKFSDIRINIPLKGSLFDFSPPDGVRIIDKTQSQ